jgi:2-keto-4-pentenoate hydratase/2-oxohepta-3-ene-1,7-dioic acid hydratase in catechol pathway
MILYRKNKRTIMKLCRYLYNGKEFYGKMEKDCVIPFEDGYNGQSGAPAVDVGSVKLLSPSKPSKIVAVGVNYAMHAKEMNVDRPAEPLIFLKPPSAVIGPGDAIIYPSVSKRLDYEAELAAVIKKRCKNVKESEAADYILGYTCANDVTCRDLQKTDNQWSRCKGFDTFAPLGPCIVTDIDVSNLEIKAVLNGKTVQQGNTSMMIHNVYKLVSFISGIMTLEPEDVIMCGTPEGIGPMQKGDVIEIEIENIGKLKNYVK